MIVEWLKVRSKECMIVIDIMSNETKRLKLWVLWKYERFKEWVIARKKHWMSENFKERIIQRVRHLKTEWLIECVSDWDNIYKN